MSARQMPIYRIHGFAQFCCYTALFCGCAWLQSAGAQSIAPPSSAPASNAPAGGGSYILTKQAIAGGGSRSSGGAYVLVATLAQANVGSSSGVAAGASYQLNSGFHSTPGGAPPESIFRNGFEN